MAASASTSKTWAVPLIVALGGGTGVQAILGVSESRIRDVVRDELRPVLERMAEIRQSQAVHEAEHRARAEADAREEEAARRARVTVVESHLSQQDEAGAIREVAR